MLSRRGDWVPAEMRSWRRNMVSIQIKSTMLCCEWKYNKSMLTCARRRDDDEEEGDFGIHSDPAEDQSL